MMCPLAQKPHYFIIYNQWHVLSPMRSQKERYSLFLSDCFKSGITVEFMQLVYCPHQLMFVVHQLISALVIKKESTTPILILRIKKKTK